MIIVIIIGINGRVIQLLSHLIDFPTLLRKPDPRNHPGNLPTCTRSIPASDRASNTRKKSNGPEDAKRNNSNREY
jgi:hypothetical protein